MKVGMILDTSFPPDARVENEANALIKRGFDVHLFSLSYRNLPEYEEINKIKVYRYPGSKLIYKMSALAHTVPGYRWLVSPLIRDFIKKTQVDVLHVHDMVIAEAVFNVNRQFSLPVVLDLHENRPVIMKYYSHTQKFPGKLLINLNRWHWKQGKLMEKAQMVILVTRQAKKVAVSHYQIPPEKIVVVPNTISSDIFLAYEVHPEITGKYKDRFNILYVGDTALRRGTDTAIKAIGQLTNKVSGINLILVGRSTEDAALKKLVKESKLENHVQFEGWQDLTLFPSYINAAQICLSPLKRNLHHDTTYANKLFQYMAMGKPVVVSDCPAQAELVEAEHCGLVHKAGSAEDLAEKILSLYNNKALALELGRNGKIAVEKRYNWDESSKDLLNLYTSLI